MADPHYMSSTYLVMDHDQRALLVNNGEQPMNLLPGFRFHPTDEELISYYLLRKAMDASFSSIAIGDIDLVKFEPWDLPERANYVGQNEWYFFCMKDRKYPTGTRANRATGTGYWKSTGKDKAIHNEKSLVGMKKTLVFYTGRAPKGHKSNWVMHEYRLDGKYSSYSPYKNEWVVCRVVKKTECYQKKSTAPVSDDNKLSSGSVDIGAPHVNCFSSHETIFGKNNLYPINNSDLCSFHDPNNPYYESSSSLVLEGDGDQRERSSMLDQFDNFIMKLQRCNDRSGKEIVTSSLETGLTTEFNQEISSCLMTPCGDHMDSCFM